MDKNKKAAIIYYIVSVLCYICAAVWFCISNAGFGVMFLCIGSMWLCFASALMKRSRDTDNQRKDDTEQSEA